MEPISPIIRMLGPVDSATLLGTSKSRNADVSTYQIESQTGTARIVVKNIRTRSQAVTESLQNEYTALQELNAVLRGSIRDSVPHPLLLLENANTICFSLVAGIPLDRILRRNANVLTGWLNLRALERTGYRVGEWLRCFHTATQIRDEKHNPSDYALEFERIILKAEVLNLSSCALENVQHETLRLNQSLRALSVPIAAKHGDFIPQNILVQGDKPGVIDFAGYRREAPIFYDLAHFLAYTTILGIKSVYSRRALNALSRAFLAGYSFNLRCDILRLYMILAILRILSDGNPSGLDKRSRHRIEKLLASTATRGSLGFSEGLESQMKNDLEVVDYDIQKDGFQNVANYDKSRYIGSANEYKKKVTSNAYKKLIGPPDSKLILDVGCGTGRGLADFAGAASLVIGADASEDMLKVAASKTIDRSGVGFVRSYAQCLPFPDSCFDVVTAFNFLHLFSLETQEEMVSEMKRVVRPGGVVVLEFDNALHGVVVGPYKRWSGRERGSLPGEIRRVIGNGCRITHIYGAVFPVVWRLFHHVPGIFVPLEKIAYYPPMNRLAHRVFYRLVKCS